MFDEAMLRRLERLALVSRTPRRGQMQGERRSPARGRSAEFADYRDYVRGDDLRAVDWNVYARLDRLYVKLFVEEQETSVHVLLDNSQSMAFGEPSKFEYAQRLAGALGYLALAGMDRLYAASPGASPLPRMRGKGRAPEWFGWLLRLQAKGDVDLEAFTTHYARTVRPPGLLLLLSDLLHPAWQPALAALARSGWETNVLHLLSPAELHPELEGDLQLVDSETGARAEITADFDLLARYEERLGAWRDEVAAYCRGHAMGYLLVDTGAPLEQLLFGALPAQGMAR